MSITITFFVNSLGAISDEDVINLLADKIKEKGFEVNCFYFPYTFQDKNSGESKKGFKFDLKTPQDEEFLKRELHDEIIFNKIKIWKPITKYESIIQLEENLSHELLEGKVKEIKNIISLDNQTGTLDSDKYRVYVLYLNIYSYSKHKEIDDIINNKKQELSIVSIELNQRDKIGELSKTSLNLDEITTFFQQEDYDEVIKDLREFMTSICKFLSTLPNTSFNSSDANPIEVLESIEMANSEELEFSSNSDEISTKNKPILRNKSVNNSD
jgi:hypothetical protein